MTLASRAWSASWRVSAVLVSLAQAERRNDLMEIVYRLRILRARLRIARIARAAYVVAGRADLFS